MATPRQPGPRQSSEPPDVSGPFEISGELDLQQADRLEHELVAYANASPNDVVEIDCSGMTFVDSSGLGMLVDVQNETGKQLSLAQLSDACRHVFETTGLDRVVRII